MGEVHVKSELGDYGGGIKLYRDHYGVPHVFAGSVCDAYFGLGYCAAQERPKSLWLHQAFMQGRLAEFLGNLPLPHPALPILDGLIATPFFRGYGEAALTLKDIVSVDKWMRRWGYYELAQEGITELSNRARCLLDAFCQGVNFYYEQNGVPSGFEPYQKATELAWWSYFEHTIAMGFFVSNAFVIGGNRTQSGHAWLAGDPHYWLSDGHSEAHIVAPGFDLNGLWDGHILLGMWGGSNGHIAMGVTAAGLEGATVYQEKINPKNREEYWDWRVDSYRPIAAREHTVRVAGDRPITFVSRRTHHGPIVSETMVDGEPVVYSLRSVFHENPSSTFDQHLTMWTVKSVDEFLAFLEQAPYVRGHRIAADRGGNIGYACNGPAVVRNEKFDWSRPVDGSVAETEWDTEVMWRPGPSKYGLPEIKNPACGFIQTANDPPWTATVPALCGDDYPQYVFPSDWTTRTIRGARQRQLLAGSRRLKESDIKEVMFDVFAPDAYLGIRTLRRAFEAERSTLPALSKDAMEMDSLLAGWMGGPAPTVRR